MTSGETEVFLEAVRSEDETTFGQLVEHHRRELHVHCYRMLASFDEAEDLVQETFLRAWRSREAFAGKASLRSWLYRIATNVTLDRLRVKASKTRELESIADVSWLQPYPDHLLDEALGSGVDPAAAAVARETIELTYMAVLQALPPRQRAVLILRDILGWSAAETAESLSTTATAVNSALQRAKATLRDRLPESREAWEGRRSDAKELEVLRQFIDAVESSDVEAVIALVHEDIEVAMPPIGELHRGRTAFAELATRGLDRAMGQWRLRPTRANRQPALVNYLRGPTDERFRIFKIDVFRIDNGLTTQIVSFGPGLHAEFGQALTLDLSHPVEQR